MKTSMLVSSFVAAILVASSSLTLGCVGTGDDLDLSLESESSVEGDDNGMLGEVEQALTGQNVAVGCGVAGSGSVGSNTQVVTDGIIAPEGTPWNDMTYAVQVSNTWSSMTVDLEGTFQIYKIVLQADCNDIYQIEMSANGSTWTAFQFAEAECPGLRQRAYYSKNILQTRYVRVRPISGDGMYSVSELQLFAYEAPVCGDKA